MLYAEICPKVRRHNALSFGSCIINIYNIIVFKQDIQHPILQLFNGSADNKSIYFSRGNGKDESGLLAKSNGLSHYRGL